jgi:hypothetical protein
MLTKSRDVYILSYVAALIFISYWVAIFILAMPVSTPGKVIMRHAPFFSNKFGVSWQLFTPTPTFNDRLYFIIRSVANHGMTDTIEVLENIASQKQQRVPFNQMENVIDHLVNNNVWNLKKHVWFNKPKPLSNLHSAADSLYIADAITTIVAKGAYTANLNSLNNYGKSLFRQKKIDITDKEIKMVITEKQIQPFAQMNDSNFKPAETVVFESGYKRFNN